MNDKRLALFRALLSFAFLFSCFSSIHSQSVIEKSFLNWKTEFLPSDKLYLDRFGNPLQSVRTDFSYRALPWTRLEEVPSFFYEILFFAEDKRFQEHSGVDTNSLVQSILLSLSGRKLRGASTITMQFVGIANPSLKPVSGRRSLAQKLKQMQEATFLEERWTKSEILEAYINAVPFRGELQGVRAASYGLFRKPPSLLSPNESYVLVAMIRSPNASDSVIKDRACRLKREFENPSSCDEIFQISLSKEKERFENYPQFLPHISSFVPISSRETRTTISLPLQKKILESIRNHLLPLKKQNVNEAAVLVLKNTTGEVLAYIGNGDWSSSRDVDLIQTKRQAGSTLKPFVYAQAFEERLLTPNSILSDTLEEIPVFRGIYRPENYDKTFHGDVTIRVALASSLNIPAVKAIQFLNLHRFIEVLRTLGFNELKYSDYYGPSLALGAADITLWELTNSYRTFANKGLWSSAKGLIEKSEGDDFKRKRVYRESVAFLITSILSDREARALTFGWESPLSTRFFTAVKTGTSQDMRDNWCIGYSSEFTVGVWVGNANGSPMLDVTGVTGAGPLWKEIIEFLHEETPSNPPAPPENIVWNSQWKEFFEVGMEPASESKEKRIVRSIKIISPSEETRIALDPDIPFQNQIVFLRLNFYDEKLFWYWNGQNLGEAKGPYPWKPKKGFHEFEIRTNSNVTLDSIRVEVR